jgi:predicted RNase H-like HicB family nuclease
VLFVLLCGIPVYSYSGELMKKTFTASVWQEGEWYIAQCREVELASQGSSKDEALANLAEAIEAHFEPPVATLVPEVIAIEAEVAHGPA